MSPTQGPYRAQVPPLKPEQVIKLVAGILVVILLLYAVMSSFYTVPANSEAVVLRFGKYRSTEMPGLHFKMPMGIDRAIVVPVREVQSVEFGFRTEQAGQRTRYASLTREQATLATMLTGDLNIADVTWIIQYQIKDSRAYLFNVQDVKGTIRDVSESVMRTLVGDRSVDEIITIGRTDVEIMALEDTQKELDSLNCGVQLRTLKLQDVGPPEEVKESFNNVNRSRQKKEQVINQAQSERNRQVPAARGKAQGDIKAAEAYRDKLILEVTGQTNALLAKVKEYNQAKPETRLRLYMEAMEKVLTQCERKVIVDDSVKGILPHIGLDEQKGGAR